MWTACVVLVLIHIATSSAQGDSNFYVDEGPPDGSGDPACHLATPRITNWTEDAFYVNLTSIPTKNQRKEHRVGYVKTVAVFDYVGCIKINQSSEYQPNITDLPLDIGKCYSYCNTDYFGISGSKCYCFTTAPLLDYKWCSTVCNDNETVCGGLNKSTSIFKIVSSDTALDKVQPGDEKNCRLYNGTTRQNVWENCSTGHHGLCLNASHWKLLNASTEWRFYTTRCFQFKMHPAVDASVEVAHKNFWLGRFKTEIIKKVHDRHQHEPTLSIDGYVDHVNKNGFRLTFSNKQERSPRLCVNDSDISTSTIELPTTTSMDTPAAATTTSLASSSFTDTSDITTQSTDKATKSANRGKPKSAGFIGSLYFYIIVGVSALVFVLLLVIVCCCCIRRKRRKGNAHIESKHSAEKQDQTPVGGDVTYDVCDTPATSGSSGAPRDTDYDTAATLATHGSRTPARGDDDPSNVYNTTQDFSNDIYDHAGASKDKPAVFGDNIYNTMATEDLYDHTSSDKSKPTFVGGNIYSTSRTVREGQDNQAEDTYDNAGGVATQQGAEVVSKADGIYDTAEGTSDDGGGP